MAQNQKPFVLAGRGKTRATFPKEVTEGDKSLWVSRGFPSSLTCLLSQPKMCTNPSYRFAYRPGHFALPDYRKARRRWDGCRLQSRGHEAPSLRCFEVP